MRDRYIATLKVDCSGMNPKEIPAYIEEVSARIFDKKFKEFFDNDVLTVILPVRHASDFKVEVLHGSPSPLDSLLKGATRIDEKPAEIDPDFFKKGLSITDQHYQPDHMTITWKPNTYYGDSSNGNYIDPCSMIYTDSSSLGPFFCTNEYQGNLYHPSMIYNASCSNPARFDYCANNN